VDTEWLVGQVSDFEAGRRKIVSIRGREVVVFNWRDQFHAFENNCLHMGGPVGEGLLIGKVEAVMDENRRVVHERFSDEVIHLVCPWHGWEYDIKTGSVSGDPRRRLRRYGTVERAGKVYVLG
jgi:nitrite reductase (NADH) small subunit